MADAGNNALPADNSFKYIAPKVLSLPKDIPRTRSGDWELEKAGFKDENPAQWTLTDWFGCECIILKFGNGMIGRRLISNKIDSFQFMKKLYNNHLEYISHFYLFLSKRRTK